jgi:hypothetical protein
MTEKQKKIAIVIGVVVIAVIILFSRKGASGNTIVNQQGLSPINVTIPGFNIPERSPFAINIPGLPSAAPYDYNAISPCMCNGSSLSAPSNTGLSITFVTNEGSAGPNVYNYPPATVSNDYYGGFTGVYQG